MNLPGLLALKPEELVEKILERRRLLATALPDIEARMTDDADTIAPEVEKLRLERDTRSNKVAELKTSRNEAQKEARELLQQTRLLREKLDETGGLKSLDPKWAKEKLEEALEVIEGKIEKQALSLIDERKLLGERKALLQKNDAWLEKRRKDNPEMSEYVDSSRKMQKLFKLADKLHLEMLTHVEKNEPIHATFVEKRVELRNSMRQVERSRALIKQSESAIAFWESALNNGVDDLLKNAKKVESGGGSSIRRRNAELPIATKPDGGEEE
ncbi:MAG: hypothetical protein VYB17_00140 [Candidatus Thermoplasmatota archaeon]|nr:hypothetical protein [Candidatus Thermoplasmatota archaeon]